MPIDVVYSDQAASELTKLPSNAQDELEAEVSKQAPSFGGIFRVAVAVKSGDNSYHDIEAACEHDPIENKIQVIDIVYLSY